jgi:RNA polymerase sigma factor (sigma-70 family)
MTIHDFAKEHSRIIKMAASISGDSDLAQDLAQELYIKLLTIEQERGSLAHICYNGQPNLSWCFTVMRNIFISEKRKEQPTGELPEHLQQPPDSIEEAETKDHTLTTMWHVISHLNSQDATSYECRYLLYYVSTGKSLRQIALEAGTTITVIHNAIKNASQRIKQNIDGHNRANITPRPDHRANR